MALTCPKTLVCPETRRYDGTQLRSHWIYETFGIQGDAAVCFVGPVEVRGDDLVDLADKREGLFIGGDRMLHVLVESFGPDLDRAVLLQTLLVFLARERLAARGVAGLERRGDDLYVGEGKLSVSIATVSSVSCLVHLGLNATRAGTPVETAALDDHGVDAAELGGDLLKCYAGEVERMRLAATKVRAVR